MATEFDNISNKAIFAVKAEASYGSDPTIALADNALLVRREYNLQLPRELEVPEYAKESASALEGIPGVGYATLEMSHYLCGAGATADDADATRDTPLLNACHWVVEDATDDRTIKPRTAPNASCWIELYEKSTSTASAGNLIQIAGCRGSSELLLEAGKPGMWTTRLEGLYTVPAEGSGWGSGTYDQETPPAWSGTTISINSKTYTVSRFLVRNEVALDRRLDGGSTYGVAEITSERGPITGEFDCYATHEHSGDREDWGTFNAGVGVSWSITGFGSGGGNRFGLSGSDMLFGAPQRSYKGGRLVHTIPFTLLESAPGAEDEITITLYGAAA